MSATATGGRDGKAAKTSTTKGNGAPRRGPAGAPSRAVVRIERKGPAQAQDARSTPARGRTESALPAVGAPGVTAPAKVAGADAPQPAGVAAILRARKQVRPASALSAVLTLAWRTMLKIKHVPFQLFDVTMMPIMFTLLFTFMFGGAVGGSPRQYLQDLLPGILVQTVVFITVYTGVGLNTDITKGITDRFRSLPIWSPSPIVGALAGDLVRYTVAGAVVLVVGLLMGFRPDGGPLGVLAAFGLLLAFAFSLSWIWIIVGLRMKSPESVMTMSFLLLFPLTFVSNIFVPESTLPGWLQTAVSWNPVTHLATASRGLMHGFPVGGDILWVLVASAAVTAVFMPVAIWQYRKER